jgi:predicted TIM-barrel fold metal-dependent hydrolase
MPPYEDPSWDPLFDLCADLGIPLVTHTGSGKHLPPIYSGPGHFAIVMKETLFVGGRNLWHFIFAGVFDRHPNLKLVITEVPGSWFVGTIADMDSIYDERGHAGPTLRRFLRRRPSDYVRTNVFFGVSFMSRSEASAAVQCGLADRVMWGSDYSHSEGTWMYYPEGDERRVSVTRLALADAFAGLTEADARMMAGANAIACYGLDSLALTGVAQRIGPSVQELTTAPDLTQVPTDYTGLAFRTLGAFS